MLTQVCKDRLSRISASLEKTPKLSPDFLSDLESSSKDKYQTPVNEDGYSPYLHTVSLSPSNRIQIKIHPSFPKRSKASSGEHSAAFSSLSLASLPNCNAPVTPFSPELDFQEWAENNAFDDIHKIIKDNHPLPRPKKFTRLARRTILDAGGALEKEGYLSTDFYFFTGTLPGSTSSACEYFARYSSDFVNSLKQFLRRLGLDLTFNCWEWQLRKKANLVPALHLHLVVLCFDKSLAARLPALLHQEWISLLQHYSFKSGVDFFAKDDKLGGGRWTIHQLEKLSQRDNNPLAVTKTIRCQKSVAAYLSKYVGKGSLSSDEDFQDRFKKNSIPLYYPSSWWSISDSIRQLIKKHSYSFSFLGNMERCMDAYHSLTSILEDEQYAICSLSLPVFIPSFSGSTRLYRNFYCKSEHYEACIELLATYSGDNDDSNFYSDRFFYIPSPSFSLRYKFESEDSGYLLSRLKHSLPFYCLLHGEIDWNNPIVLERASDILYSPIQYAAPNTLEQNIRWQNYLDNLSSEEKESRFFARTGISHQDGVDWSDSLGLYAPWSSAPLTDESCNNNHQTNYDN